MVVKPTKEPALYHFYKIVCKDISVKDFYIGSTISWARRKCLHNRDSKTSNALVYKKIREHGGFNNWLMLEIEKGMYIKSDAVLREYELMQTLGSTLNTQTAIKGRCKHDKVKEYCRECGGCKYCKHDKRKERCRECGGSAICKHDKRKERCRECGGSAICKHDKQKHFCRECGGSAYCKHNKQKHICRECGGSSICKHDKQKYRCRECKEIKLLLMKIEETKKKTEEIKRMNEAIMIKVNKALNQSKNKGGITGDIQIIERFINKYCVQSSEITTIKDLYHRYCEYCKTKNISSEYIQTFSNTLLSLGFEKKIKNKHVYYFIKCNYLSN